MEIDSRIEICAATAAASSQSSLTNDIITAELADNERVIPSLVSKE